MTFGKGSTLSWSSCIGISNGNIFRNMTENRKRSREDDTCEFMPLSKRINNLHINNNLTSNATIIQEPNHNQINGGLSNVGIMESSISSPSSSSDTERRPSYDPGISSADSSYYFNNKLLFELHLERIQRSGQQFPF